MPSDRVRIADLADHPGMAGGCADLLRATWPDWYGAGGQGDADADVAARLRGDAGRRCVVALAGARVVGTVALSPSSHGAQEGEGPWIVGLAVVDDFRGQGIASAMIAALQARARADGHRRLWTTTQSARCVFGRVGWSDLRRTPDGWSVMDRAIA